MQLIRCTKKLQKEIGLKPNDLVEEDAETGRLGSWHANLLLIDRRKCVLFVNDKTLFNFIIPGVKKAELIKLDDHFKNYLQCILADEGFDKIICDQIQQEYDTIGFANTNNKSVMGSMNDLAFNYTVAIQQDGGVNRCMIPQIIYQLNRMPMKAIGYGDAIEALKSLYGIQKAD